MKLVITGAESFIGRELVKRCRKAGIDRIGIDVAGGRAGTLALDIRDRSLATVIPQGVDAMIHLAAISRDSDCARDPRTCYDVNVTGTLGAFEAARTKGVGQFIFASTEWVYDRFDPATAKSEDDPIDSTQLGSHYALSKLLAESALRLRQRETGMPVTVLRFGIVYGPRPDNWSAVENLLVAVAGGQPVRIGSRATARCFVHVSDIADGIIAACGRDGFQVVNLQGDRPITLGEVIDRSAELVGRSPEIIETDPANPSVRNVSNARAATLLGWRPQVDLPSGLRSVADFLDLHATSR